MKPSPGHIWITCPHGTTVRRCRCPGPVTDNTAPCPDRCPEKNQPVYVPKHMKRPEKSLDTTSQEG